MQDRHNTRNRQEDKQLLQMSAILFGLALIAIILIISKQLV
jgi:hypothetical protein